MVYHNDALSGALLQVIFLGSAISPTFGCPLLQILVDNLGWRGAVKVSCYHSNTLQTHQPTNITGMEEGHSVYDTCNFFTYIRDFRILFIVTEVTQGDHFDIHDTGVFSCILFALSTRTLSRVTDFWCKPRNRIGTRYCSGL